MKVGDIITIYEDPMTCQKVEGNARLVEKQPSNNPPFELWLVDFGDVKVMRWIKVEASS